MEKEVIADLHIHSRFSRACSKDLTIPNLEKYARLKGLDLLGTGDFQHPKWLPELKSQLVEEDGILKTKSGFNFVLQTEISLIYSQDGRGYRVHNVVLCPSFDVADQVQEYLKSKGRIDYDGRPIFKIPCDDFTESLLKISKDVEIVPAHAWTPWFALYGSKSGFDSIKDCFKDQTKNIHAIETGLSSDPPMNWRVAELDRFALISSSDSHSFWPWRIGREATVFDMKETTYKELLNCIRNNKIKETIEFYPEEGKYHFDGHRSCGVCLSPEESKKINNICPKCKKELTVGVASRVEELASYPEGRKSPNARPFRHVIPLSEVIGHVIGAPVASKKVWDEFTKLTNTFGNEFAVLEQSEEKLREVVDPRLAKSISNIGRIQWKPGHDGVYGVPIFDESKKVKQKGLMEF